MKKNMWHPLEARFGSLFTRTSSKRKKTNETSSITMTIPEEGQPLVGNESGRPYKTVTVLVCLVMAMGTVFTTHFYKPQLFPEEQWSWVHEKYSTWKEQSNHWIKHVYESMQHEKEEHHGEEPDAKDEGASADKTQERSRGTSASGKTSAQAEAGLLVKEDVGDIAGQVPVLQDANTGGEETIVT